MISMAFFEPDIAANFGAGLRLAACLGLDVDVVEPCGFPLDDRRLKRAAMDYGQLPRLTRHASFARFYDAKRERPCRIVLLTRHAATCHDDFRFKGGDVLLVGRESTGVTPEVLAAVDARVCVPMATGVRSLNVVTALAIVVGEAMRQLGAFEPFKHRGEHER